MHDSIVLHDADKDLRWPTKTIPYLIDPKSEYTSYETALIDDAVKAFERYTCIKFVRRNDEPNYIRIISEPGICSSFVGFQSGEQHVKLGKNLGNGESYCMFPGTVQHELMHAIGFFHEQSRMDRDEFVTIGGLFSPGELGQFEKRTMSHFDLSKNPYDYDSIMHYDSYAFSKDKDHFMTIIPKKPNQTIGQRFFLSPLDAMKINNFYQCDDVKPTNVKSSGTARNPCTFDDDLCGWIEEFKLNLYDTPENDSTADDFDWVRTSGDSGIASSTPTSDHTTNDGFYLFAPSYHLKPTGRTVAVIRSPVVQGVNGTFCLSFFYFMPQASDQPGKVGTLNVYIEKPDGTNKRLLWSKNGTETGDWTHAAIADSYQSPFQFAFEAILGEQDNSDIALDDFAGYRGSCATAPHLAQAESLTFI